MNIITLDWETFYDNDYSLSKLATEDYCTDPRFQIILCGVKQGGHPPVLHTGGVKYFAKLFNEIGLWDSCVVAHQAIFDLLICKLQFNRLPKMMICTRMLAQALLRPYSRSVSLKSCLEMCDLGVTKGDTVLNMKGRSLESLSRSELAEYAEYCSTDCEGTYRLFKFLAAQMPPDELLNIDLTLRMYLEPMLELDPNMLALQLAEIRAHKVQLMNQLPTNITKADLMSNEKFAKILLGQGVEPPRKVSPTTGLQTWAFAKNDLQWKELEDEYSDDPVIGSILAARLGTKSTLAESRTERLLEIATRHKKFRVPIMYYAAHTGRDGGTEGINAQNFPRVDKSRMRFAIRAPKGHAVLAADLKQIEARITAMICGQLDLVEDFRQEIDIYAKFASRAFKTEVVSKRSKEDDKRRFVGKTCILGLGFGMGAPKLRITLRKDDLKFTLEATTAMVQLYRFTYPYIQRAWDVLGASIPGMASGKQKRQFGPVMLGHQCIVLPNGMTLSYPKLQMGKDEFSGQNQWLYEFGGELRYLWGGKLLENIVQALARILVMNYQVEIYREMKLRPVIRQHDELDFVVRESEADAVAQRIGEIMQVPPHWMPDLPVGVEINYGPTLGDCK